jgi:hypothetical protein
MQSREAVSALVVVLASALIGCSAWKKFDQRSKEICAETLQQHAGPETATPEEPFTTEVRARFLSACSQALGDAVEPCRKEHTYGTDSAIQCIERYANPVLQELAASLIHLSMVREGPRVEAVAALNVMWAAVLTYYESEHLGPKGKLLPKTFPSGTTQLTPSCCAPDAHCPTAEEMAKQEPWTSLNFTPREGKVFQYQFVSAGAGADARFIAVVAVNQQCKGKLRYFSRRGHIDPTSGDVTGDYSVVESDAPPSLQ